MALKRVRISKALQQQLQLGGAKRPDRHGGDQRPPARRPHDPRLLDVSELLRLISDACALHLASARSCYSSYVRGQVEEVHLAVRGK